MDRQGTDVDLGNTLLTSHASLSSLERTTKGEWGMRDRNRLSQSRCVLLLTVYLSITVRKSRPTEPDRCGEIVVLYLEVVTATVCTRLQVEVFKADLHIRLLCADVNIVPELVVVWVVTRVTWTCEGSKITTRCSPIVTYGGRTCDKKIRYNFEMFFHWK